MTKLSVSVAAVADLPEIAALVNSAYRGATSQRGWTSEGHLLTGNRTTVAELEREIALPNRRILTLRKSGELIGCVALELGVGEGKQFCYLGMLTVNPVFQNQQIGRSLMTEAENYARQQGLKRMILGVIQLRPELIAWYERRGYLRNGETKPFPPSSQYPRLTDQDMHFVFMEKPL